MGWAERINHTRNSRERQEAELRHVLAQFPDRAAYERWLTTSQLDDVHRAHLEHYLPAHLLVQGTV